MLRHLLQSAAARLEARWANWEPRLARRFGTRQQRRRVRWGLLAPALLMSSVLLWTLTGVDHLPPSPETMRELTPWVGAGALFFESVCLLRIVWRIVAMCHAYAESIGDDRIRQMRSSLLPVLNFLVGVLVFAGVFYYFALDLITDQARIYTVRLLWYLTVGGLAVAILIGELVGRFLDIVEDTVLIPGIAARAAAIEAARTSAVAHPPAEA